MRVRLGVDDVAAMARLRDDVIMGSTFEDALRRSAPRWERPATDDELRDMGFEACAATGRQEFYLNRASNVARRTRPTVPEAEARIRVDRGEFMECYARLMMRFSKLTPHQREKLEEVRAAKVAVLLAPAGGGKTFVAIQRVVELLNEDPAATVLFVARNKALALFVCKWRRRRVAQGGFARRGARARAGGAVRRALGRGACARRRGHGRAAAVGRRRDACRCHDLRAHRRRRGAPPRGRRHAVRAARRDWCRRGLEPGRVPAAAPRRRRRRCDVRRTLRARWWNYHGSRSKALIRL